MLLFNKDPDRTLKVRLMQKTDGAHEVIDEELRLDQYSAEQYSWHSTQGKGNGGHPEPNDPPAPSVISADAAGTITLPPHSISVAVTQP